MISNIIGMVAPLIVPPGPGANSAPKIPTPIILGVETAIIDDPVVDLLKQLLPADSPVGTVLERFREAVASLLTQQPANDAAAKLITLLKTLPIDLKTVTGEELRSSIDRLGLRYEPMLQSAFAEHATLALPQLTAQNLKAALLTLLSGYQSGTPVDLTLSAIQRGISQSPGPPTATPFSPNLTQPSGENLESDLLKQLQAQSRGMQITSSESDPQQSPNSAAPKDQAQVAPGPAVPRNAAEVLPQAATTVIGRDMTPAMAKLIQSIPQETTVGSLAEDPLAGLKVASNETHSLMGPRVVGAASDGEPPISTSSNPVSEPKTSQLVEQIQKSAVAKLPAAESPVQNVDAVAQSTGLTGKQATDVRQQAHELLSVLERTQVLNTVNSERGEPLTFQIPFILDGRSSTAEFYVDGRSEEGRKAPPEERHYSVVALLDLSELGALRVDLALHKKELSVKVTVEREDTKILASQLLPELARTLGEHGFAVEFLRCELKTDGSVRGEELRDRPLPEGDGLINIRA